jgi:hypothetical protein
MYCHPASVILSHLHPCDWFASAASFAILQPLPAFLEKAIQLYEMIVVRHGLMLVGWSFGMKTAAIRVLAAALGDMCAAGQVRGAGCPWCRFECVHESSFNV